MSTLRTDGSTMTVAEAAAHLGVHERTVRRAIRRGEIEARKRGRAFSVSRASVKQYAQRERTHPRRSAIQIVPPALPDSLTSFVGRETFLATLTRMVQRGAPRLITLTGPGGVGKTRLALRLLASCAASFRDGVAFVPLAAIRDPSLVLPTIAQSLGLPPQGQAAGEQVRQALAKARLLLVLDNLEQVRDAGPELAALVAACPGVMILVTSRVRLQVTGEHALVVPPLSMPTREHERGNEIGREALRGVARAEAVRLFVERARDGVPGFVLTADNAADIAEICQRLDGFPLAIELAAARMRHLQLGDLRGQLDRALPLLAGGPRDGPMRFQSMRDAIAWSYNLLSPQEQAAFCWLSVFMGGFSREAAESLTACAVNRVADQAGCAGAGSLFELLCGLIDQSLVQVETVPEVQTSLTGTRYAMFEIVREYGLEQLAARGEEAFARDAHASWCLEMASRANQHLMGPAHELWFAYLTLEQANVRTALAWLLQQRESERGLALIQALGWFWTSRGYLQLAAQALADFLAISGAASSSRGELLLEAANIARWQKDYAAAVNHAVAALALYRTSGNALGIGLGLRQLGSVAIDEGRLDAAAGLLAESEPILLEHGRPWDAAFARYLSGRLAVEHQQWPLADLAFAAAAAAFNAIGDHEYVAASRCRQAAALLRHGDVQRARAAYIEGLTLAQELGLPYWIAWGLSGAAALLAQDGQYRRAARLLGEASCIVAVAGLGTLDDGIADAVRAKIGVPALDSSLPAQTGATQRALSEAFAVLHQGSAIPEVREAAGMDGLSPRERAVLTLLARGYSDKEIATALQIARYTATNHVAAIRRKLGVQSRAAAAALGALSGALGEPAGQDCVGPAEGAAIP